jgi:hypothetical protein
MNKKLEYIFYKYRTGSYHDPNVIDVCIQTTTGRENTVIHEE